ncbi:MAG TPA: hypothetical protein ENI26_12060 [Methylophaga aminisulfidivorans]|uniref:ImmA/IrrE family metallo-endopeptidase n=1 Tax=Methylophaga aminisulfidivorans TaxID=230105 RepID=A0A7C1W1E1_9GAMM|nr:hypothetical protein [Methylophaga aminisulfidivorans]
MDVLLQSLLVWALSLTRYDDPGYLPKIEAVSHKALATKLCDSDFCTAVAYYDSDTETIFYDNRMKLKSDDGARGFLLHEMVHFLQHKNGEIDPQDIDCKTRVAIEHEAYRVQQFFLKEHHKDTFQIDMAVAVLPSLCADEVEQVK